MRVRHSIVAVAGSVVVFHLCSGYLLPGERLVPRLVFLSAIGLLLCVFVTHSVDFLELVLTAVARAVGDFCDFVTLIVYKLTDFFATMRHPGDLGSKPCVCGSRKMLRNCCGRKVDH
jgi:hypothetical protein